MASVEVKAVNAGILPEAFEASFIGCRVQIRKLVKFRQDIRYLFSSKL
jgi:hypothetical protein